MTIKVKIIICIVVVVTTFAFGRYSAPEKVKVETKIVEVDRKSTDKESDIKIDIKRTTVKKTVTKPDGTKETTVTVVVDNSREKEKRDRQTDVSEKTDESKKEITKASDKVTISALGGVKLSTGGAVYGASVTKPILGPITVGVWGLSDLTLGASLGLTF